MGVIISCDEHGDYEPRQCVGSVCHCADPATGEKHHRSPEVPIHRFDSLDCAALGHHGGEVRMLMLEVRMLHDSCAPPPSHTQTAAMQVRLPRPPHRL